MSRRAREGAEADVSNVKLISLETPPTGRDVEIGELVTVSVVQASNVVRDVRELIINIFGGRMRRYESLLDSTMERAVARFRARLSELGYDGALGVRFVSPKIVDGGAELIIYGTGFKYRS